MQPHTTAPTRILTTLLLAALITACADPANDWDEGAMAVTANPHATDAAALMLERGGHAVDAAIAAHLVLGLVEPQSSGIGGGLFMLVYEREAGQVIVHNGRETAPAGATPDMFMRGGEPMPFVDAWQSGLSVGVPGAIAAYEAAHNEHGKLPWADLFQPAIDLAEQGFAVSPRLSKSLQEVMEQSRLDDNPATAAYFYPNGRPLPVGHLLKNPDYANTLRRVAHEGTEAFYLGSIAAQIAAAAQAGPNPGSLTEQDLRAYRPSRDDAVCGGFRHLRVCGVAPPSSGALQIILPNLYDLLTDKDATDEDKVAAFVDAQRLAYADRDHYYGDPDFVDVPLDAMLTPAYLQHRASQRFAPAATPTPGNPLPFGKDQGNGQASAEQWAPDTTVDKPGTTHISIVDGAGNAVAMTASVEYYFGSSRWAAGFLLNNQLTDFDFEPTRNGKFKANAAAPGKQPRSSMSPTLILDKNGDVKMLSGSPGGSSIIAYVFKTVLGVLDWGLTPQQAVDHPNIVARGEQVRVEVTTSKGQAIADDLKARGYNVYEHKGENSGLHVIVMGEAGLVGAADSRREGTVRAVR